MTATEASRNFKAVLDAVEAGETIVVTRGDRRVAVVEPAPRSPGKAVKDLLSTYQVDTTWEREHAELRREMIIDEPEEWAA